MEAKPVLATQFLLSSNDCTQAIRFDPTNPIPHYNRGGSYFEKGEFDEAVVDFTEAIRLAPTRPDPYARRAEVYRALGNEEGATEDEQKAQELSESSGQPP